MKLRSHSTTVPRITKKSRLFELAAERCWARIGEPEWLQVIAAIPNISPEDLKALDLPIAAPWHGVRQHSLDELEFSLVALSGVYETRTDLRSFCRRTVIRAKDRARWASQNSRVAEHKRKLKAEMAEWMLIWLSDPALFPTWVQLRRQRL
jgi:hypothetical protein